MSKLPYPPDWGTEWRTVKERTREAFTAAQSRARYVAIRAASIIIGQPTSSQITIDPDTGGGNPSLEFDLGGGLTGQLDAFEGAGEARLRLAAFDAASPSEYGMAYIRPDAASVQCYVGDSLRSTCYVYPDGTRIGGPNSGHDRAYVIAYHTTASMLARPPGYGPRGEVYAHDGGAGMFALDSAGQTASALVCDTDGRIIWTGTWDPPPSLMAATSAPVADPGADASTTTQVAYLRSVVEGQAAQIAEMQTQLAEMPPFRRVDPDQIHRPDPPEPT